jgi:hypothetical protein
VHSDVGADARPPAPHAHRQRASNVNRSTASRSEQPSSRCSTITHANADGGTLHRPRSVHKSANPPIWEQPDPLPVQQPT